MRGVWYEWYKGVTPHPRGWLCCLDECMYTACGRARLSRSRLVETYCTGRRRGVHPEATLQNVADCTEAGWKEKVIRDIFANILLRYCKLLIAFQTDRNELINQVQLRLEARTTIVTKVPDWNHVQMQQAWLPKVRAVGEYIFSNSPCQIFMISSINLNKCKPVFSFTLMFMFTLTSFWIRHKKVARKSKRITLASNLLLIIDTIIFENPLKYHY